MPLVAHNNLPTFQRLRDRGHEVLSVNINERFFVTCKESETMSPVSQITVFRKKSATSSRGNRRQQFMQGVDPDDPLKLK